MAFEILGGDLIQRAGRNARGADAQFFGLGQNFLVLDSELLRNIVDTNGHITFSSAAGPGQPSWQNNN
jgi:hypothetical protein